MSGGIYYCQIKSLLLYQSGAWLLLGRRIIRVLVIDDNEDFAQSSAMVLASVGFDTHFCTHSRDALAMIETLRPDVVMLDILMPGLNGFEIVQELRDCPDLCPKLILAVSGHGGPGHEAKYLAAGFDAYVPKPLEWPMVTALLYSVRDRKPIRPI